ncbi:cylG protein [Streptococcus agalactiae CJB111]|nr:cylG protein [Streptococcus agalactiae CJB111]
MITFPCIRLAFMIFNTALLMLTSPIIFMLMTSIHFSLDIIKKKPSLTIPALLTKQSIPPYSLKILVTNFCTAFASEILHL